MSEQITQEQACNLAEWLGWIYHENESSEGPFWESHEDWCMDDFNGLHHVVRDYLYSPEGQEAVMDKLGETNPVDRLIFIKDGRKGGWIFRVEDWYRCPESRDYEGNAPTRQHALLLAVLEMLKGGE